MVILSLSCFNYLITTDHMYRQPEMVHTNMLCTVNHVTQHTCGLRGLYLQLYYFPVALWGHVTLGSFFFTTSQVHSFQSYSTSQSGGCPLGRISLKNRQILCMLVAMGQFHLHVSWIKEELLWRTPLGENDLWVCIRIWLYIHSSQFIRDPAGHGDTVM